MANRERNKRSARKARAEERAEREARQAQAAPATASSKTTAKAEAKKLDAKKAKAAKKPGVFGGLSEYFKGVKTEMRRVTWPSQSELKNYAIAVIGMLILFGVVVWLLDTGVVAALKGYTGLRG